MRKLQKREILGIVATLYEAHEEIKNIIAGGNYATAQGLLAQCQECAVSIGNAIEKSEGEGILTISYIEEYCDVLYHAYGELGGAEGINAGKIYKGLRKSLLRVENSVRNDVPVRKEIVFFPYKASMWDSLESVYLKAKEDLTCDAYCVPIPYYDVNSDGSLGQMHYEGGEYPKNIEIIDWEKYDFENIKPDVAYIHNPYDDCNLVTRIHSRFYASNLKKYVGELIYIPYFVLREIEPDDQNAIDGMKHFIWTPGVVNADKVIVQSEKMAQIYRNEFRKAAIANGLPEKYTSKAALEKKILGLGSPKIEKVKNTKIEDLEIPQEWQKIINKPDGSRKKIVFYNTSVGALLENNEKMLEKMKDVFRIFKENKDEIALLWRPHPLIETTVKAMRPQLWDEYKKIVEQYKAEDWGIYDDTADMDRAVVLSDAYYGDGSSVVQLYQQTGKPVMMQDVCDTAKHSNIYIEAMTEYEGAIFMLSQKGVLYRYIACEGTLEKVKVACEGGKNYVYRAMAAHCGKLFLFPYQGDRILIYDLASRDVNYIQLKEKDNRRNGYQVEAKYDNKIFLIGDGMEFYYPEMLCLDAESYTIRNFEKWKNDVMAISRKNVELHMYKYICVNEASFWVPIAEENMLLEYNMKYDTYSIFKVGDRSIRYSTVAFDGVDFWLSGNKNFIVRWNKEKNEVIYYEAFPEEFYGENEIPWDGLFSANIIKGEWIYYAPLKANMFLRIHRYTGKMENIMTLHEKEFCFDMFDVGEDTLQCSISSLSGVNRVEYLKLSGGKRSIGLKMERTEEEVLLFDMLGTW